MPNCQVLSEHTRASHCSTTSAARAFFLVSALTVLITALLPCTTSAQVTFTENTHACQYGSNLFAAPCDLDEDGWTDMLVTDRLGDRLVWLRNTGATTFDEIPIPDTDGYLTYPFVIDLDFDGDLDIIGSTWANAEACWWENDGSENFTIHVAGAMPGGHRTIAVDIDEDDDLDLFACGLDNGGGNRWFENDGGMGFTEHILSEMRRSHCVDHGDLDGDEDIDIVTTDRDSGLVIWENDGEENFTSSLLPFPYCHWVLVDDLDEDLDLDLLAVGYNPSEVAWWENDGVGSFTKHSISTTFLGPLVVDAGDLDEDGDRDVAAAGVNHNDVFWWENDGNESFTPHPLTGAGFVNAESVQLADLNGDSDLDLVCAGAGQPCVRWYESSIVNLGFAVAPPTGIAPVTASLTDSSVAWYPITEWAWDCDLDGLTDATGAAAAWDYYDPGTHSILLEVAMGERVGRMLKTDCIEVFDSSSALRFEGGTGVVTCADVSGTELTGPLTVEAWIAPSGWGGFPIGTFGFGQVLDKGNVSLLLTGTHPTRNNESFHLELRHSDATVSGASAPVGAVTLNEWQHVAATYDGLGTVRMWVNGVEQMVTYVVAPSGGLNTNAPVSIGNIAGTLNRGFEGAIDEVRLWNVARSGDDILADMDSVLAGTEAGLAGYWRLDDGNGTAAADASPSGADGVVTAAAWVQGVVLNPTGTAGTGDDDIWANRNPRVASAPNPFRHATAIALTLGRASSVRLTIHDLAGRLVAEISHEELDAGVHSFEWDGRNSSGAPVAAGVYFCRAESEHGNASGKMVLLK